MKEVKDDYEENPCESTIIFNGTKYYCMSEEDHTGRHEINGIFWGKLDPAGMVMENSGFMEIHVLRSLLEQEETPKAKSDLEDMDRFLKGTVEVIDDIESINVKHETEGKQPHEIPEENPFRSLGNSIAFDSRDWGMDKRSAWIYGIVLGWDEEAREEIAKEFKWTKETMDRLERLHLRYKSMKNLVQLVLDDERKEANLQIFKHPINVKKSKKNEDGESND